MQLIDDGTLYFTSKRVVFNGTNKTKVYPLHKILSLEPLRDGIWISLDGKEKKQLYSGMNNPLVWLIALYSQKNLDDGKEIPFFNISIEK